MTFAKSIVLVVDETTDDKPETDFDVDDGSHLIPDLVSLCVQVDCLVEDIKKEVKVEFMAVLLGVGQSELLHVVVGVADVLDCGIF